MLVLSRKPGEKVVIGSDITVTVVDVSGYRVRVGIDAPKRVRILRAELDGAVGENPFDHDPCFYMEGTATATRSPPKSERTQTVKIVTFTAGQVRQVENVIATELEGQTNDLGECHLLLDFTNVEFITSVELGTLVSLQKKMNASGGRLTLFNLTPQVFEVFTVTCLQGLIEVCR